jgi:cytochrome c oxidase subunit 3
VGEALTHPSPYAEEKKTAYLGMVLLVASWAMMFICIFLVYGAMRFNAREWPPIGLPLPDLLLPTLNTGVMIGSSFVLEWGLREVRRGSTAKLAHALAVTTLLGAVFVFIQYVVAVDLKAAGLEVDRGAYAAVLYGLSGIHAAHVALGVIALGALTALAYRGAYTPMRHLRVRLWAVYWHFVGVIWLAVYLLVFII